MKISVNPLSTLILALLLLLGGVFCASANANTQWRDWVPNPQLVGKARLSVWFWDVYDAQLFAPQGAWQPTSPFALELKYLRDFEGQAIAKRSIEEMRKQGFDDEITLARWFDLLRDMLPDVEDQSRITGIADAQQTTRFYYNDTLIGSIAEPLFTQHFFAIWLGEDSSEPDMRDQLLGRDV